MNKWTERLLLGIGALVIGLVAGWAVRGLVSYNTGAESVAAYEDWRVACPPAANKDQRCEMQEEVMDTKIRHAGRARRHHHQQGCQDRQARPGARLDPAARSALPPGVGISIGTDKPTVFGFRTCNQVGCIAVNPLDDKMLTSFASAKDAKVLVAGLDGKVVAIPISFKGYGNAVSAYQNACRARFPGSGDWCHEAGVPFRSHPRRFLLAPLSAFAQSAAPSNAPPSATVTDTKAVGDWTVRCFSVASTSPCDMYQEYAGEEYPHQRVLGFSLAYVPKDDKP